MERDIGLIDIEQHALVVHIWLWNSHKISRFRGNNFDRLVLQNLTENQRVPLDADVSVARNQANEPYVEIWSLNSAETSIGHVFALACPLGAWVKLSSLTSLVMRMDVGKSVKPHVHDTAFSLTRLSCWCMKLLI